MNEDAARRETDSGRGSGTAAAARNGREAGETPISRRQLLSIGATAGTVGLAGCVGRESRSPPDCSAVAAAAEREDGSVPLPADDDISMFRRGLGRYGYYPDETVPAAVRVDWSVPTNEIGHTAAKSTPRPTPDGETILIASDTGRIDAYTPAGERRWGIETGASRSLGFHGTPAIVDGTAYIGGYDGDCYAIDIDSGEVIWRTAAREFGGAIAIGSSPAYVDGTLYLLAEYSNPDSGALWELDAATGTPTWSDDRLWGMPHPSPAIDCEAGRLVTGSNDGVVYCWEFPSLEFAWSFQAGGEGGPDGESKAGGRFNLGAQIKGTIPTYDGAAFVGSWDGRFYRLDLADGSEEWSFQTGNIVMSNPAIDPDQGVVYVGSDDHHVYALDTETGDELWSANVGGRVIGSVTATAESILVGSYDTHLYALDRATGERRWRVENRGHVTSGAIPRGDRIYYAERGVVSNFYNDDEETVLEEPGHAYCLVPDE
ncbi:PQQ-binding-like beta-propeller repeat protein [Natrinema longum]|uniref:PQQ-binding-like beta-propeller repeat protein n=1 Tax=Natrinema longum TaxID=370324 RepID=A0A8A2UBQ5_9EURY|nr:PQQ-binding-like beta-propeller repeat protein [Natrinema longum]MBZ6496500.1 PQQ-binding-like beta-propeller repeat protein [Natrinema longum]QSW85595.1 PQQ-binding-like beta-propeller repeat protein [Natrinema longum]